MNQHTSGSSVIVKQQTCESVDLRSHSDRKSADLWNQCVHETVALWKWSNSETSEV